MDTNYIGPLSRIWWGTLKSLFRSIHDKKSLTVINARIFHIPIYKWSQIFFESPALGESESRFHSAIFNRMSKGQNKITLQTQNHLFTTTRSQPSPQHNTHDIFISHPNSLYFRIPRFHLWSTGGMRELPWCCSQYSYRDRRITRDTTSGACWPLFRIIEVKKRHPQLVLWFWWHSRIQYTEGNT